MFDNFTQQHEYALFAGPLGCFIVWRRMAYFGDTMAHSALLGVGLGFLLGVNLTVGVMAVTLSIALILVALQRWGHVATDTLLGILSHSALSLGLVLIGLLWRSVRREVELERQHRNFLSAVTHELKSPLASMRLALETVASGRASPEAGKRFLGNAIEVLPPAKGLIEIATRDTAKGIEATVQDNGPGINGDHETRIFDPFFTTKAEGTGLGLHICRDIVQEAGGVLELRATAAPPSRGA